MKTCNKNKPNKIIEKLFSALNNPENDSFMKWCYNGTRFQIIREPFCKNFLPDFARTNKWESFAKQMRRYQIKLIKFDSETSQFEHPLFKKGRIDLLKYLRPGPVSIKPPETISIEVQTKIAEYEHKSDFALGKITAWLPKQVEKQNAFNFQLQQIIRSIENLDKKLGNSENADFYLEFTALSLKAKEEVIAPIASDFFCMEQIDRKMKQFKLKLTTLQNPKHSEMKAIELVELACKVDKNIKCLNEKILKLREFTSRLDNAIQFIEEEDSIFKDLFDLNYT